MEEIIHITQWLVLQLLITITNLQLRGEGISKAFSSLNFILDRNVHLPGCKQSPAKKQSLNTRVLVREWTFQIHLAKGKFPVRGSEGIWMSSPLKDLWFTGGSRKMGCCCLLLVILLGPKCRGSQGGCGPQFLLLPGTASGLQSQLLLTAVVPEKLFSRESVCS